MLFGSPVNAILFQSLHFPSLHFPSLHPSYLLPSLPPFLRPRNAAERISNIKTDKKVGGYTTTSPKDNSKKKTFHFFKPVIPSPRRLSSLSILFLPISALSRASLTLTFPADPNSIICPSTTKPALPPLGVRPIDSPPEDCGCRVIGL